MNIGKNICICLYGILIYSSSFGMSSDGNNNNNNNLITFKKPKPLPRFILTPGVKIDDFHPSHRGTSASNSSARTQLTSPFLQNSQMNQSAIDPNFSQTQECELRLFDCSYFIRDGSNSVEYGYTELSAFVKDVYLESWIKNSGTTCRWYNYSEKELLIYVNNSLTVLPDDVIAPHISFYININSTRGAAVERRLESGSPLNVDDLNGLPLRKISYGYRSHEQIKRKGTVPMKLLKSIYGDDYSPRHFQVKEGI